MHWSEPTTWKRVKDNAREIARTYRWRRICAFSGLLTMAVLLCARYLLPDSETLLTVPGIIGVSAAVMFLPLTIFIGALQTGSVIFRRKCIDVSDSFVHCFIPYEQIVRLGFERFDGKSYFYVRGVPRRGKKEVEVHVALTAKYTESDIEAYIIQKGLGRLLAVTREVDALPIRTKAPTIPHLAPQKVVLMGLFFISFIASTLCFRVMLELDSWFSAAIVLAWLAEIFALDRLLGKGARQKAITLGDGMPVRRVVALGVPYMLTIALNPAIVFVALRWAALPPTVVWTASSIWQFVWMAFVYGVGRLFRCASARTGEMIPATFPIQQELYG